MHTYSKADEQLLVARHQLVPVWPEHHTTVGANATTWSTTFSRRCCCTCGATAWPDVPIPPWHNANAELKPAPGDCEHSHGSIEPKQPGIPTGCATERPKPNGCLAECQCYADQAINCHGLDCLGEEHRSQAAKPQRPL